jgi:hypothetical protein
MKKKSHVKQKKRRDDRSDAEILESAAELTGELLSADVEDDEANAALDSFEDSIGDEPDTVKKVKHPARTNLEAWLADPRADQYFGSSFRLKWNVLAQIINGRGSLVSLARRHGVTRQAVHRHAQTARKLFGIVNKTLTELTPTYCRNDNSGNQKAIRKSAAAQK